MILLLALEFNISIQFALFLRTPERFKSIAKNISVTFQIIECKNQKHCITTLNTIIYIYVV